LLLITAGLKAHALATDTWIPNILLSTPRALVAAIEIEAVLGCLLLSGRARRFAWGLALVAFGCLAAASLYMAIDGQADCGCLGGNVHASPWWMFTLDATGVLALLIWRPLVAQDRVVPFRSSLIFRVSLSTAASLTVIAATLLLVVDDPTAALAQLRGESIIIRPAVSEIGDGLLGEVRLFPITLENVASHAICIQGGTADCRCLSTKDLPLTIPPGQSRTIQISAKFLGRLGSFERHFRLFTDDDQQTVVIARFAGRVIAEPTMR
jgi:hypothetical protein